MSSSREKVLTKETERMAKKVNRKTGMYGIT